MLISSLPRLMLFRRKNSMNPSARANASDGSSAHRIDTRHLCTHKSHHALPYARAHSRLLQIYVVDLQSNQELMHT